MRWCMVGYWRYDTTCIHSAKAGDCEETKLSHKPLPRSPCRRDVLRGTTTGCQLGSWLNCKSSMDMSDNWTMQYTCSYARLGSYGAFCRRRPEFFRLTPSQSSVDLPSVRIPTTYLIGCNLICLSIQEQCLLDSHDLHDVVRPWGRPSPVLAYPYLARLAYHHGEHGHPSYTVARR